MRDQSVSAPFQALFEVALQEYEEQTDIILANHPVAIKLKHCDSVESVTAIIQEQVRAYIEFRGDRIISVLFSLSASVNPGLPFPLSSAVYAGLAILLAIAKDASAHDTLVDLLDSIDSILKHLEIYTKIPPTAAMTGIIVKTLLELLSVFALATKLVKQGQPGKTPLTDLYLAQCNAEKLVRKFSGGKYEDMVLERLDRLTLDEARITAEQILEVVYGLVQNMRVIMDDGKTSIDHVQDALEVMQDIVSDMNKSKRDKLKDLRRWLSPPDPWMNHNVACKSHHHGTAAWFVQGNTFSEWKASDSGSLLWIWGKPGAGKSILCSTIIQDIDTMRKAGLASLAFFYCDFRDDQKKDFRGLLSSLLDQLCHQADSYCEMLFKNFTEHTDGSWDPSDDTLARCLKDLLKLSGHAPVYLIVDALDECPNTSAIPSPRAKVLNLIDELIKSQFPNLRICITSRPEMDIKDVLDPLFSRSVSLHDESGQKKDIVDYIESFIHTHPKCVMWKEEHKQLVVDVLTEKADGMFRWVDCQAVYICGCIPRHIQHALANLPETLDETYRRSLREINEEDWDLAHRLFQFVVVASRPLYVEELAVLLAFDSGAGLVPTFSEHWRPEDRIVTVLSRCSSLLAIAGGGNSFGKVIQLSHISVIEFLTSPHLAESSDIILRRYHVSMTVAHTIVAQACLDILLHLYKDAITGDSLENSPLVEYAAEHWVYHARFGDVSQHVEDGMKELFHPRKAHLAVCIWIRDPEIPMWERTERADGPSPLTGTHLHYAALWGLPTIVRFLVIEHLQDVHSRRFTNMVTPLHLASKRGHVEVARSLLEHGADVTAQDKDGWNPLHLASQGGHVETARLLLVFRADVTAKNKDGWNPLHLALSGGHVELVRIFIEHGKGEIAQGKDKWTLHRAPFREYIDVAQALFNQGAEVTTQDGRMLTPLHLAAGGHVKLALILLDHGPDAAARDWLGMTPWHLASSREHVELACILLDGGANVTAQDKNQGSPLHWASSRGDAEIARILVQHGADADARDNDNCTPLHWASQQSHPKVVRFLLEHGADAEARDNDSRTPLHWASHQGHLEVARFLLKHGVDGDARDNDNCSPLHWASQHGHLGVVHVLVEHGTDINARDHSNWTPLHGASQNGHLKVVRFLLEHGADADASDQGGWTSLQWLSYNGDLEIVRVLLKHGADANTRDNSSWTPLHVASRRGHRNVVLLLLEYGADVNSRDDSNQTPLHLASREGHLSLVQLLVKSGANIHVRNKEGRTPLNEASVKGHRGVMRMLLERSQGRRGMMSLEPRC